MDILEVNKYTLANLYDQFPESFKDLTLDGNDLVYNGERIDISNFNINDLLSEETNFATSLSVLSSEDVFRIIRLHALFLESKMTKSLDDNEAKVEIIKRDNPLMKNISIISRVRNGSKEEYINIVDSRGEDHLFINDRNLNIFDIYEALRIRHSGRDVTPDELIYEVNRRLYDVRMDNVSSIVGNSEVSEDFENKMNRVNTPYKNDVNTNVYGNESHDIAIVRDLNQDDNHRVVTFDENRFGDLVLQSHEQNVIGTDTVMSQDSSTEVTGTESGTDSTIDSENEVFEKVEEKVEAVLISTQEFYDLLNSPEELTEEQRKSVDLFYAYLGDLVLYEDYLLPELREILNQFRLYVYELQYGDVPEGQERHINNKQQEAIDKSADMELKAANVDSKELTEGKVQESVKKLELIKPKTDTSSSGSVSVVQVVAFIIGVSIILTAVTLYLIG